MVERLVPCVFRGWWWRASRRESGGNHDPRDTTFLILSKVFYKFFPDLLGLPVGAVLVLAGPTGSTNLRCLVESASVGMSTLPPVSQAAALTLAHPWCRGGERLASTATYESLIQHGVVTPSADDSLSFHHCV